MSAAYWPVRPEQDAELRALGWVATEDQPAGERVDNYTSVATTGELGDLAARGTHALEVLGADPAALGWQTD